MCRRYYVLTAALNENLNKGNKIISGSFHNQKFTNKTEYIKENIMSDS